MSGGASSPRTSSATTSASWAGSSSTSSRSTSTTTGSRATGPGARPRPAFRLKTYNPALSGLASKDGAYDRHDWDSFEDTAAANGVTLVPEFDAPAHSLAFIRFKPSLGLDNGDSDHLDLSKPETTAFMKSVFDEFTPWFRGPDVHFGADEYRSDKPRYKSYFNEIAAHIRTLGKHPRAWGSLSLMTSDTEGFDRDVTLNSWNNSWYGPQAAKKDGYSFINTNDALLYIVPFASYYHGHGLDGKYLYDNWEPNVFPDGQSVAPKDPQLLGAMSSVWNDLTKSSYTELDVHELVEPTFGVLAQKMWSGADSDVPYSDFMSTVRKLGVGTGLTEVATTLATPANSELSAGKPAVRVRGHGRRGVRRGEHHQVAERPGRSRLAPRGPRPPPYRHQGRPGLGARTRP